MMIRRSSATSDRFRQEVRLWCENELLPKWGDAVLRDDPSAATQLAKIEALGGALEKASGEREIADAVEAIRKSGGDALRQLAKGHVAYGAGLQAEKQSTVQEATADMATAAAALDPRVTPFAWRARMEHAGMLYSSNQYRQALAELQQLEKECGARLSIAGRARLRDAARHRIHSDQLLQRGRRSLRARRRGLSKHRRARL